jgi:hypothetical protein
MAHKPVTEATRLPGIDLDFRPRTYFWPLSLETHLLAQIKGAERKEMLKNLIATHRLDSLPECLSQPRLSDDARTALGRIHPAYMGGEYLPDTRHAEVEIARITIASVTQDVTSVYASRGRQRIRYRVVDEYDGATLSGSNTRSSAQPLTLGELEAFLNDAWSVFDVLEMNFRETDYPTEEMFAFVRCVDSAFYPQIDQLYRRRIGTWAAWQRAGGKTQCFR